MSVVEMNDQRLRDKIVTNRKQMGFKREDVVVQLQLLGLDVSYLWYKEMELGRRKLGAIEFFFIGKVLNIDVQCLLAGIAG